MFVLQQILHQGEQKSRLQPRLDVSRTVAVYDCQIPASVFFFKKQTKTKKKSLYNT